MANTVEITLSNTAWTIVNAGATTGLVTNESNYSIIIKEAGVLPAVNDLGGHTVFAGPDGFYNYSGITGNLYARGIPNLPVSPTVTVTPS